MMTGHVGSRRSAKNNAYILKQAETLALCKKVKIQIAENNVIQWSQNQHKYLIHGLW